jgi:amino acid adenylation domain-containing protein
MRPAQTAVNSGVARPLDFAGMPEEDIECSLVTIFERVARKYPDQIAVTSGGQGITYHELNRRANVVARAILDQARDEKGPVALLLSHDFQAVVAIFGVLKTGRPYLPLTDSLTIEGIGAILGDAHPSLLISNDAHLSVANQVIHFNSSTAILNLDSVNFDSDLENLGLIISPRDQAYIMYTSGSTGEPKGVVLNHRHAVMATISEVNDWFISPSDRLSMFFAISFSASRSPLMNSLLCGATCCMFEIKETGFEAALDWLRTEKITIYRSGIPLFRSIFSAAQAGAIFPDMRLVCAGGQTVTKQDIALFRAFTSPESVFMNGLSSTETANFTRYYIDHKMPIETDQIPLGYPWDGKELLILEGRQPVAQGESGEIVIKSRYLSSGYLNRPDLTAEKFRPDPEDPDIQYYSSGDEGMINAEGALIHLGRKDNMVKIRGFRIQLETIDLQLRKLDGIQDADTVPFQPTKGEKRLVAYLVSASPERPSISQIRDTLATQLPDYMLPSAFVWLNALPQTTTGKVNRRELPPPPTTRPEIKTPFVPPGDQREQQIALIWQDLLGLDSVGVDDNFFELGGDSLLTLSMTLEVEKKVLQKVPASFFRQPTIKGLIKSLGEQDHESDAAGSDFNPGQDPQPVPKRSKRRRPGRRKLIIKLRKKLRHILDDGFIFEWILFQFIKHLPFQRTRPFVPWLANRSLILHGVYRGRYKLFCRALESLGVSLENSESLYRANFISNLLFKMIEARGAFGTSRKLAQSGVSPKTVYFDSRRNYIEDMSLSRMDEEFPVAGFQYLENAYREGRGVIMVSFHGSASNRVAKRMLARRLGSAPIETISLNIPVRQSSFKGVGKSNIPEAAAASLFAEAAYHGQLLMQQGQIINIAADFGANGPGRSYSIQLGDREYRIKAGFAELALNTGAQVIPAYGRFLDDGRLLVHILPPLDPGSGPRSEQIKSFIQQYEKFINSCFRQYPEMLNWVRIKKHLRQPLAQPGP